MHFDIGRALCAALVFTLLAGCGRDATHADTTAARSAAQAAAPTAAHVTTTGDPALDRDLAALKAGADRFAVQSRAFELTEPRMRAWVAAMREATRLVDADPALEQRWDAATERAATSFDAVVAELEREPAIRRAFERAGISAREFVFVSVILPHAATHVERSREEPGLARPEWITEQHITFVRAHQDEVRRAMEVTEEEE